MYMDYNNNSIYLHSALQSIRSMHLTVFMPSTGMISQTHLLTNSNMFTKGAEVTFCHVFSRRLDIFPDNSLSKYQHLHLMMLLWLMVCQEGVFNGALICEFNT